MLSEDVKLHMELLTSNRYYALNDRTINLLMKGDIDISATVGEDYEAISISDAEVIPIIAKETKVEVVVVGKNKTRAGGAERITGLLGVAGCLPFAWTQTAQ